MSLRFRKKFPIQVELGNGENVSPWVRGRYYSFLRSLEDIGENLEFFNARGALPPRVGSLIIRGGSEKLAAYVQSLPAGASGKSHRVIRTCRIGVNFGLERLSRAHDVEFQFLPVLDIGPKMGAYERHAATGIGAQLRRLGEVTDIFVVASEHARNDLIDHLEVDPDMVLVPPAAWCRCREPPLSSLSELDHACVFLVDGLTTASIRMARVAVDQTRCCASRLVNVVTWHYAFGDGRGSGLSNQFDLARPMTDRERLICLRNAKLVVLVGSENTTTDVMQEVQSGQAVVVAPSHRGYEAFDGQSGGPVIYYTQNDEDLGNAVIRGVEAIESRASAVSISPVHCSCSSFELRLRRAVAGSFR